ncbi:MAG: YcxB family protein [Bacteroidota bacterium]
MLIRTRLQAEDLQKFSAHVLKQNKLLRIMGIVFAALMMFILGQWLFSETGTKDFPFQVMIPMVVFVSLFFIFIPMMSRRNFKNNPSLQGEILYTFTDEQVEMTGPHFESRMDWDKYMKVEETKEMFLLFQSKALANLIPKRDLTSEEIQDLRELISSIPNLERKLLSA